MKRFSKTFLSVLLAVLVVFAATSCTTSKVEEEISLPEIQVPAPVETAEAPAPAPVEKEEPAPAPEPVPAPEPAPAPAPAETVVEEPQEVLPYGVTPIVKNTQGDDVFDLFIVHTNDINGQALEGEGLGLAKLATLINAGRQITNNVLVLDAGNAISGSELADESNGALVGAAMAAAGYDAMAVGAEDFAYGQANVEALAKASADYDLSVLSVNALTADGYLPFQPYQVYDFNDFRVAVVGVTAPVEGTDLVFTSPLVLQNAQYAIDLAHQIADYVVVLGAAGDGALSADVICSAVNGIDLFVTGDTAEAGVKTVNGTVIVSAEAGLKTVGLVQLRVANDEVEAVYPMYIAASDILDAKNSLLAQSLYPVAKSMGFDVFNIAADPAVEALLAPAPVEEPVVEEPVVEAPAVEEPAVEEPVEELAPVEEAAMVYPFGVTPIVKNTQGDDVFDLFVVHTNDVHGRVREDMDRCQPIGYAKLSTLIKAGRSITDNILVLDAGDTLHGTNFANLTRGESIGNLLVMTGYDAIAPGNHDFNYGTDRLLELRDMAEQYSDLKVLAANITDDEGYLYFQPYQIYDFNGFKVCVLGLTTPDTKVKSHPKNTEGVNFMDDIIVQNAQYAIDMAHELCDYVIVVGHVGVDKNGSVITSQDICQAIDGIDLFVDGHSHTSNEELKEMFGEDQKVNGTTIVSAEEYMKTIGLVQLHVENGEVTAVYPMEIRNTDVQDPQNSALVQGLAPLAAQFGLDLTQLTEIPEDPVVAEYINQVEEECNEKLNVEIAELPYALDGERAHVRTKKTNLAKLICMAMTEDGDADFTITNGGGIRASMPEGIVTLGDVNNTLPFTNTLAVVEMTGKQVWEALEYGFSALPEADGRYAQTDLQVIYSKSAPAGERIRKIRLNGEEILKDDTVYRVATNDFLAAGGDGYTMFGKEVRVGRVLNEIFAEYLAEKFPIQK